MKNTVWILLLLFVGSASYGQYQDARLWASLSVRYDPGKKWKISLEEEARIYENISRLDKLNTELDINYQITRFLDGGVLYRLISKNPATDQLYFNHRFGVYLGASTQYSNWNFSCKTSFQKTYPEFRHSREWYIPVNYVRLMAEISRNLKKKKTETYINIEFLYRTPAGKQAFVDQYRFTAGIKHKLNKRNRVDIFYRLQQEIQVNDPLTGHILGVGYRYFIR